MQTIEMERKSFDPFFYQAEYFLWNQAKGVWVWDESGRKYLDFTAGWGVTSLGHTHPCYYGSNLHSGRKDYARVQMPD